MKTILALLILFCTIAIPTRTKLIPQETTNPPQWHRLTSFQYRIPTALRLRWVTLTFHAYLHVWAIRLHLPYQERYHL